MTRPQTAVILVIVTGHDLDRQYATRKIFQDYVNKREQLRERLDWPDLTLNSEQEKLVLAVARSRFRQRESEDFKRWFVRFMVETNMYLTNIKIGSWPLMRDLR